MSCILETNTLLYVNYTSIKVIKDRSGIYFRQDDILGTQFALPSKATENRKNRQNVWNNIFYDPGHHAKKNANLVKSVLWLASTAGMGGQPGTSWQWPESRLKSKGAAVGRTEGREWSLQRECWLSAGVSGASADGMCLRNPEAGTSHQPEARTDPKEAWCHQPDCKTSKFTLV